MQMASALQSCRGGQEENLNVSFAQSKVSHSLSLRLVKAVAGKLRLHASDGYMHQVIIGPLRSRRARSKLDIGNECSG
jgi:hypothetical protein